MPAACRPIYYRFLKGRTRYDDALRLQEKTAAELAASAASRLDGKDRIFFLEHAPVYTGGRRMVQDATQLDATRAAFAKLGADYHQVQRGGQITFHGPGQLVAYPILNLRHHFPLSSPPPPPPPAVGTEEEGRVRRVGVRDYVHQLEQVMIQTCAHFGVKADTSEDTGVWINGQNKIGAIGIQVSRGITMHGLALNCDVDLAWYKHIVACGLVGKGITTLSRETGRPLGVQDALPVMIRAFEEQCGRPLLPDTSSSF